MQRFFSTRKGGMTRELALSLIFSTLFVAVSVGAATTISTSITTGGNLTVMGTASVTGLTTMVYASSTTQSLTGNLSVGGHATTTGSTGNIDTTGSLTVAGTASVTGLTTLISASTTGFSCLANCTFGSTATTTISSTGVITINGNTPNTIPYASTTAITATTASTTNLIVGGNGSNGTIAGIVFGTCDLAQASITASTTAFRNCSSATGVTSNYKVFVMATSSLVAQNVAPLAIFNGVIIVSASSTAANIISVELSNITGAAATPAGTLNFWAVK